MKAMAVRRRHERSRRDLRSRGKQMAEMPIDVRACECCPTAAGGDGGWSHRRLSRSQRRRDSRHLHLALRRREMVDAGRGAQRSMEDHRLPGQRPRAQRRTADRGDRLVHRQRATKVTPMRVLVRRRRVVRHADSARRRDGIGRVDVQLLGDGSAIATWIEFADGRTQFRSPSRRIIRTRGAAVSRCRHHSGAVERISTDGAVWERSAVCMDRNCGHARRACGHRASVSGIDSVADARLRPKRESDSRRNRLYLLACGLVS